MRWCICAAILVLSACQAFSSDDVPATLRAENVAYVTEDAAIESTTEARRAQVEATVIAVETYVADVNNVNRQLVATLRAGNTPTVAVMPGAVPEVAETASMSGDASDFPMSDDVSTQFVQVATAASVRGNCAGELQSQFPQNTENIYITARGLNVRQGMIIEVEWHYEMQPVYQENWTIPVDSDDYCLWFYISPAEVEFTPGNWTVQLSAEGQPVSPSVSFIISE